MLKKAVQITKRTMQGEDELFNDLDVTKYEVILADYEDL